MTARFCAEADGKVKGLRDNSRAFTECVKFLSISESRIMRITRIARIFGNWVSNQWQMRA